MTDEEIKGYRGEMKAIIPIEKVQQAIYLIRGQMVMLSTDLDYIRDV